MWVVQLPTDCRRSTYQYHTIQAVAAVAAVAGRRSTDDVAMAMVVVLGGVDEVVVDDDGRTHGQQGMRVTRRGDVSVASTLHETLALLLLQQLQLQLQRLTSNRLASSPSL